MGYKEQILKILNGNKLTVKELAEKLNISESDIRVYIKRIKDNNMNELKVVGTEDKYKVYTLNKKESDNGIINRLDTQILKRLIKPFTDYGIKVDLETNEINRIKELWEG